MARKLEVLMLHNARIASLLVLPFVAGALLVGCSTGAGESSAEADGSTSSPTETDGGDLAIGGDTGCIAGRTWDLDVADLGSQIATELATTGYGVVEYAGIGSHTLLFDESGTVGAVVDMLFSITVTTDAGAQITLVQIHKGSPSGEWGWRGNTNVMDFANWNSGGYTVQNLMTVNDIPLESTIPIPSDPVGGTPMIVECAGSRMTTTTEASPYIQRWTTKD
jgi:hypothetical protein